MTSQQNPSSIELEALAQKHVENMHAILAQVNGNWRWLWHRYAAIMAVELLVGIGLNGYFALGVLNPEHDLVLFIYCLNLMMACKSIHDFWKSCKWLHAAYVETCVARRSVAIELESVKTWQAKQRNAN